MVVFIKYTTMMNEVIICHVVAKSPGGDVAPSSGVNSKREGVVVSIDYLTRMKMTNNLLFIV